MFPFFQWNCPYGSWNDFFFILFFCGKCGFFNTSQACWNKSSKRPAVNLLPSFRGPVLRARWRGSGLSIFGFEEKRQKEKHRQTKLFLRMFFYFIFIPHETQPGTDAVNWLLLKKKVFYMYNCEVGQNQLFKWSLIIFRKHSKTRGQRRWRVPDQTPPGSLSLCYLSLLLRAITGLQQQL